MSPRRLSLILACCTLALGIAGVSAVGCMANSFPVTIAAPLPAPSRDIAPVGVVNRAAASGIVLPRTTAIYLFTNHPAIRTWTSTPRRT